MSDNDLGVKQMSGNAVLRARMTVGEGVNQFLGSSRRLFTREQVTIAALILLVGVTSTATALQSPALGIPEPVSNNIVTVATPRVPLSNGTYLYGQAPVGGQLGREYMVFEVRQGQVIGAMYMPSSEFSCFQGVLENNQMNVTVASTYDNSALTYQLAQEQPRVLAAVGDGALIQGLNSLTYPHTLELQNFHQINNITTNDQRLLATCQAKYQ